MNEPRFDIAIVGAGIAGASLAWRLVQSGAAPRVLLLEAEEQPGYHSTGRSAAMFMESYGPPQARALTRASRGFYSAPPAGFADVPLMAAPRGALYVGWQGQQAQIDAMQAELQSTGTAVQRLDAQQTLALVPVLRADGLLGGVFEADAADLDVHALHQGFLRGARAGGAVQLWTSARLRHARRDVADANWQLLLADGRAARAGVLVNAAGAWADELAQCAGAAPVGLQPKRRSAFTFAAPEGLDLARCPLVAGVDEGWYFKPDAGQMLGSPANADDVLPQDVQPEELDIATGIYNIETATTLQIRRPHSAWAGLRSFVPDGELVIGFDPACEGLFWLAGQGGYGIQSAAGASELAAALLLGQPLSERLLRDGVEPARMSPARLRR